MSKCLKSQKEKPKSREVNDLKLIKVEMTQLVVKDRCWSHIAWPWVLLVFHTSCGIWFVLSLSVL